MKILKGTLKETRFDFPKNNATPPEVIKETTYSQDQVTYMADELGLHKISNPDPENIAVSLHRKSNDGKARYEWKADRYTVYTPPNAAHHGCYIYNEMSGKRSHITQSNFYSVRGEKVESFQAIK